MRIFPCHTKNKRIPAATKNALINLIVYETVAHPPQWVKQNRATYKHSLEISQASGYNEKQMPPTETSPSQKPYFPRFVRVFFWLLYSVDIVLFSVATFFNFSRAYSVQTRPNIFHASVYFSSLFLGFILTLRPHTRGSFIFSVWLSCVFVFECLSTLAMLVIPREQNIWRNLLMFHVVAGWEMLVPLFYVYLFRHLRAKRKTVNREAAWGHITYFFVRLSLWTGIISGPFPVAGAWAGWFHGWILLAALPLLVWHLIMGVKKSPVFEEFPPLRKKIRKGVFASIGAGAALFCAVLVFLILYERYEKLYRTKFIANADPKPVKTGYDFSPSPAKTPANVIYKAAVMGNSKESCGEYGCHQFVFNDWLESPHRRSNNVFFQKARELAVQKHGEPVAKLCAGCHDPISLFSGSIENGALMAEEAKDEGISCMVCHSMTPHKKMVADGSYTFFVPARFFEYVQTTFTSHTLKKEHLKDFFNTDALRDPDYCGACHRVILPKGSAGRTQDVFLQDPYTSWKEGPFHNKKHPKFKKEQTCQNCHMPRTAVQERPAQIVLKTANHRFAVTNSAVPFVYGDEKQIEKVREFLQSGIVKISVRNARVDNGVLRITVRVQNRETGHVFPAGPLDINEVWLEINVQNEKGKTVYHSGFVDKNGYVDKSALFFKVRELDKNGKEITHHDVLSVAKTERVRVLEPLESRDETYEVKLPPGIERAHVFARLRFRKFNQEFTDWVFGKGKQTLPVVDVSSDKKVFTLK